MSGVFSSLPQALQGRLTNLAAVLRGRLRCLAAQYYSLCVYEERRASPEKWAPWQAAGHELRLIDWVRRQCAAEFTEMEDGWPRLGPDLQEAVREGTRILRRK